jgi:PKD repeat protein
LYGVKVLDRRGSGYVSDIIAGIEWAVENGADIISMSFGTTSDVQSLHGACDEAWNNGVLLVAAAGNEWGSPVIYPAAYSSVIAVSATNSGDELAPFSSTGPEVELAAPGVSIYSTVPGGYGTKDGTSMACPHVTGTAASVIASGISGAAAVRQQLTSTAEDIGAAGWDSWYGHGLVDADEAAPSTNEPPVADANGPYTGDEGSLIEFDGSGSSDPDGTIDSYDWDFGDGTSATGETVTHAYAQDGTYTATLTVTDDDGEEGTGSAQVEVADIDPVVAFSYSPTSPAAQSPVQFTDESTSYDGVASWSWDFDGDGTEDSASQNPAHSYNSAGEYTVSLTVEEADGDSDMATQIITVSAPNQPPDANAGPDQTANEGETVNFDGSSSSDSDGTIDSYDWDFGDETTGAGETTAHEYADNGIYTVTLTVTDTNGATGMDTATVTIENVAPAAVDAGSDQMVNEGATVSFSGSFTDPGSGDTHTIEWNFGDGNTSSGSLTPTHAYADDGGYTVTLTVTDDDSGVGTDTASLTVDNVAPTAEAGGPYSGIVDEPITLAGSATDPGTSDTLTYSWDFGDGNSAGGQTVSHTYSATGAYTATLTVTDDDGGEDTDTATVDITEAEVVEFYDSFEEGLGSWTQDTQNDWFVSTQRATDGRHSAEVDGRARDATLTMAKAIDLSGKASATLTFSWFIEGSWDNGEYIKLDISANGGDSWTEVNSIDGKSRTSSGPDENKWIPVSVDLTEDMTDNFKIRFRAKVSNSREDGNVDKVKITSVE